LVVDDDEAMRDLLATTLGLAGATVETAGSGEEALQTTGHFDLVLIDFSLGDARGDQLLSDLQGRGQVGASALVSGASLPPTLAASPDAWLRKPFELDDLLGAISSLLSSTIDKDVRSG
jgi:two-component system OmpR family response regulator